MHARKHMRIVKKTQWKRTVKNSPLSLSRSLSLTRTHIYTEAHKIKKQKHICPQRFWQELRQAEMNTEALKAHSEKSAVRKTHITGSPPTKRGDECQENARCIKRRRCYQSRFCRRSRQTKYHCHLYRSGSVEINPNKCNEWFTKYLAD